jgi:hypothetical protein
MAVLLSPFALPCITAGAAAAAVLFSSLRKEVAAAWLDARGNELVV